MRDSQLPAWVGAHMPKEGAVLSQADALTLAHRLACESAVNGGGPFGAVLLNRVGLLIEIGWNSVVPSTDSTAHAEIGAIRRGQRRLNTHSLREVGAKLFCSVSPCIQCFGAIYWAGISEVVVLGDSAVAERYGFDEGPVDSALWLKAKNRKGVAYHALALPALDPELPFKLYQEQGGIVY